MAKKKPQVKSNSIAKNKKARFEFFIQDTLEAGISLEGWEVKSLRAGKIQLGESYVMFKNDQAWLFGALITPLITASTHNVHDPLRTRPLLMHRREINRLRGLVDVDGLTVIPLELYWKQGKVKLAIGIAKGKKLHDKRATMKERDWNRDKQRILKNDF
ncbi:SsrA-binding protein SmpB [Thiomicrorhabdus sp. Milos-T2]|uniref:SsrA-binding protein SmpB n=1 Tax=Thiomicrorhabdus sp. Milos-T2 TaxID=90814 RepID=UPI000493C94F|nr:SsrA-binding protein SmpB [Thiomicrorhabdus sp. Milos-T2]